MYRYFVIASEHLFEVQCARIMYEPKKLQGNTLALSASIGLGTRSTSRKEDVGLVCRAGPPRLHVSAPWQTVDLRPGPSLPANQ